MSKKINLRNFHNGKTNIFPLPFAEIPEFLSFLTGSLTGTESGASGPSWCRPGGHSGRGRDTRSGESAHTAAASS